MQRFRIPYTPHCMIPRGESILRTGRRRGALRLLLNAKAPIEECGGISETEHVVTLIEHNA